MRLVPSFFLTLLLAFTSVGAAAQPEPETLSQPTLFDLLLGEIARQRGDHALAAKTYLDLARRTRDPRVARRAVEMANAARLPEVALEAANIWYEIEPSMASLQIVSALLIAGKRVDEAEPYLEKLLTSEGVSLENGFMQLNRLLSGNPDKPSNLRVVRNLAGKHPDLPQAHFALAQASAIAGLDEEALGALRQAQSLRPDWEAAVIFESQLLQKRSPAEASRRLGEFVEKNPQSREARLSYARVLVLEKRLPQARQQFEAVLAANPGNSDVVYAVGLLAFQLKDYGIAEENLKRLLGMKYRDHDGVRFVLGQIAEEQKRWPAAITWYGQITGGERVLPARIRTAGAIAKQGKLDEARAFLKRVAVEVPGQQVQMVIAEAQLLRDASRHADAYEVLSTALKAEPKQPELLYDLALTAEKLERFDELESSLRQLIAMRPDHAHAYNALGYSYAERNMRLAEARKLIERALQLSPEDYFIVDSLGWVQYREGDLKAAAGTLRRAYRGRPDAEIGAHLGEVLWMLGERDEAGRIWDEALKAGPTNDTLQKTIKRLRK